MLRATTVSLADQPPHRPHRQTSDAASTNGSFDKNPLKEGKDDAARGDGVKSLADGGAPISYFPDEVAQISYLVAVVDDESGLYLEQLLRGGMENLASQLAPNYFAHVRKVTASVDGWFPAACPTSRFEVCQDVSASIGLYLSISDPAGVNGTDPSYNQEVSGGAASGQGSGNMTQQMQDFQSALEVAIADDQLQQAIDKLHYSAVPAVYVVTDGDDIPTSDPSGESAMPGDVTSQQASQSSSGLTTGGIIGIVLVVLASVLVVATLAKLRRVSANPPGDGKTGKSGGRDGKAKKKHGKSKMETNDPKSASTLGMQSATDDGDYYYYNTQGVVSPTSHTRSTTSTGTSTRGTRSNMGDVEVLVPVSDESRELLGDLDNDYGRHERKVDGLVRQASAASISRDGRADRDCYNDDDDDEDSTIANLIASTKSSDLCLAPTNSSDLAQEGGEDDSVAAVAEAGSPVVAGKKAGLNVDTAAAAVTTDEGSVSAGSSGWSSNASPSTVESHSRSPHYPATTSMADTIAALNAGGGRRSQRGLKNFASGGSDDESTDENEVLLLRKPGKVPASGEANNNKAAVNEQDPENDADDERDGSPLKSGGGGGGGNSSSGDDVDSGGASFLKSPSNRSLTSRPFRELDDAIMIGDWAAVGATAALMSASVSPAPGVDGKDGRRTNSSRGGMAIWSARTAGHPERAAELDRLIEAGDWEAVMVAAAKFDLEGTSATEDGSRSVRSRTTSQGSDTMDESLASTMDHSSVDRTAGRSVQTSASHLERIQEIRAEVEAMVRDVVPDEVENIDEMMTQFKGKEEELLETLRTMKERDVAKKFRQEAHKLARRNTRSREKKEDLVSIVKDETPAPIDLSTTATPSFANASVEDNHDQQQLSQTSMNSDNATWSTDDGTGTADGTHGPPAAQGSFEQAATLDPDAAASAAAEWAIQRSLAELNAKAMAELNQQDSP